MSIHQQTRPLEPEQLTKWLVERQPIWQLRLLNASEFSSYSKSLGLNFSEKDIVQLWQLAIVRADVVTSKRKLRLKGLTWVGYDDDDGHIYSDSRFQRKRKDGWYNAACGLRELDDGIQLFFHPFRYSLLYHVDRIISPFISKMQLFKGEFYPKMLNYWLEQTKRISSSDEHINNVAYWNDVISLAVATEPCVYSAISGVIRRPGFIREQEIEQMRDEHWHELAPIYQSLGRAQIERLQKSLCTDAEMIDPNKQVHNLLRLASNSIREGVKGKLGGAMLTRSIAETLRRGAEGALHIQLPEEDELGFGWTIPGIKEKLYGSNRLFDNNPQTVDEFLRRMSLHQGIKVRWYVEGETEFGAITEILSRFPSARIEVVNLRGRVVQNSALSFRDSLVADNQERVFSFILLDGDRSDNLRVVRRAAEDDIFCGRFYISKPDVEFHNFTLDELEDILWQVALENGATADERMALHSALEGVTSGKALLKAAPHALPALQHVAKGATWGRYLASYAVQHPRTPSGEKRPLIQAVEHVLWAQHANYRSSRQRSKVDPQSGQPVDRSKAKPAGGTAL